MGKYRAISTAEKRAMLEAAGEEWPVGSDGLPMCWHKNGSTPNGGSWRLRSFMRDEQARYRKSEEGRATRARYDKSEEGRDARARYNKSEKGRRARVGIAADAPPMSLEQIGLYSSAIRIIRKTASTPTVMTILDRFDPKKAKLIRLAVSESATPFERRRAVERYMTHKHIPRTKEETCLHPQTTSAETRTPLLLPRSTSV